jgi:pimeloyl-ACP methyl ester carboxylesterase
VVVKHVPSSEDSLLFATTSARPSPTESQRRRDIFPTFVLVHGAWHGGWCWELLQAHLEASGAPSIAIGLPGRAGDPRPTSELTLDSYVDRVVETIDSLLGAVVLVGHSLGGLTISQAAERVPDKVSSLVYVCAMLLRDGQSTMEAFGGDPDSQILSNVSYSADSQTSSVIPDAVHDIFFAECTAEVSEGAQRRLVPEPIVPASTPVRLTAQRWGRIPRAYILCTQDRAISPHKQQEMIDTVGVDTVGTLNSSHSPFLSQPAQLVAFLLGLT